MRTVHIEDIPVGDGHPCYLAIEVGTTSNGDLATAKRLIDACAECDVNAVKFQTISADDQESDYNAVYHYLRADGPASENMYRMLKKLAYSREEWLEIADYTRRRGLQFFSTVDYLAGVALLEECGAPAHKIGAWDTTYYPLIRRICETKKPLVADLGPTTFEEVIRLLDVCKQMGNDDVILLHDFHTEEVSQMNMRAIPFLKQTFRIPVGFSSPGRDDDLDLVALALGANMIEKRLTMDRQHPGHHHFISLEPDELKTWISRIRRAENTLGDRSVRPSLKDLEDARKYYRSICATRGIQAGETFNPENLNGKRPGTGISTQFLPLFWGRVAKRDIAMNTLLTYDDL